MREIKFRVWDKRKKIMECFTFTDLRWESKYGVPCYSLHVGEICLHEQGVDNYDVTIMQYTGLYDKHGREIYEGDIVQIGDDASCWSYDQDKFVVELDPPRLWLIGEEFGFEGEKLIDPSGTEIIGNRFENPELLEGEK